MLALLLSQRWWLKKLPVDGRLGMRGFVLSLLRAFAVLDASVLLQLIALSVLFQAVDIAASLLLAEALGLKLDATTLFIVMPVAYLATLLPISLGGLGVRALLA